MIYVLLPAYNEEVALPRLTKKLDEAIRAIGQAYQIVVVDDGSSDETSSVTENLSKHYPLEALRHPVNLGLGQTMIDGFEYVGGKLQPEDIVVTMDCDDTHDPSYIASALAKIREGYDVVILSRYQKGGGEQGLSVVKSVLSRGAGLFLKLFFPIRGVKEYSCGYRVIRGSAILKALKVYGNSFIRLPHMGFVVTPETLIKFRMLGLRIAEVPFTLHYDQKPGASKNRPLKTIGGYFGLVWHYWGRKASQ